MKPKTISRILEDVYVEAYKCGVGTRHPDEYRSVEAVVEDNLAQIQQLLEECAPTKLSREVAMLEFGWADEEAPAYNQAIDQYKSNIRSKMK